MTRGGGTLKARDSLRIVENFWREIWPPPQNVDAIDRLVTDAQNSPA